MLLKLALSVATFFLLASVTITSKVDQTSSTGKIQLDPQQLSELVFQALYNLEMSSQLASPYRAILAALFAQSQYSAPLYAFLLKGYNPTDLQFDIEHPEGWNLFVDDLLTQFALESPEKAQSFFKKVVIPKHPFLSQYTCEFVISVFIDQHIPLLVSFLEKAAMHLFAQHLSQILTAENHSEAQIRLKFLLYKLKQNINLYPQYMYHYTFLTNVPNSINYIKSAGISPSNRDSDIYSYLAQLAPAVYRQIVLQDPEHAQKTLRDVLPSVYYSLPDNSYDVFIQAYQESQQKPIDHSFLWDPQQLVSSVAAAIKEIQQASFTESACMPILKAFHERSSITCIFFYYIAQN